MIAVPISFCMRTSASTTPVTSAKGTSPCEKLATRSPLPASQSAI